MNKKLLLTIEDDSFTDKQHLFHNEEDLKTWLSSYHFTDYSLSMERMVVILIAENWSTQATLQWITSHL